MNWTDAGDRIPMESKRAMGSYLRQKHWELYNKAAQEGFMSDIQQEANRLKQLNPQYVPFANKLLELSQRFDDKAILNLLQPYV